MLFLGLALLERRDKRLQGENGPKMQNKKACKECRMMGNERSGLEAERPQEITLKKKKIRKHPAGDETLRPSSVHTYKETT